MSSVVAVIRGGGLERSSSMKTGDSFLRGFAARDDVRVKDIVLQKNGSWVSLGRQSNPENILVGVDVLFNALHGQDGEGGDVQNICSRYGVKHTGVSAFTGKTLLNKVLTKEIAGEFGTASIPYVLIENMADKDAAVSEALRVFGNPVVVKPVAMSGSKDVGIFSDIDDVSEYAGELLLKYGSVLIEPYIRGTLLNVFVMEGLRGEGLYTFPVVEVSKKSGEWGNVCPADITGAVRDRVVKKARDLFRNFNGRHYMQLKFIQTPNREYFLEANNLPKIYNGSLFKSAMDGAGVSVEELTDNLFHLV